MRRVHSRWGFLVGVFAALAAAFALLPACSGGGIDELPPDPEAGGVFERSEEVLA